MVGSFLDWITTISIHAPLTGSDLVALFRLLCGLYFNPRSPYGERHNFRWTLLSSELFQSTLPLRGATRPQQSHTFFFPFQSTLPLRGATALAAALRRIKRISIHAPLTGSDWRAQHFAPGYKVFQSTLPLRGATLFFGGDFCAN